jgi:NADH:ubiquinone oxidoreductase subunit D
MDYVSSGNLNRETLLSNNMMEDTIKDFKYWSENIFIDSNIVFRTIEAPKGEFGVTLVSDGSNHPYRVKVRSPAYQHLQLCPKITKGHFLADLVAIIGTIDIVFGEIDR